MAPIVNNREALDHATDAARPTLVIVESFEVRGGVRSHRYRSCSGFILHVLKGSVYVAVPKAKVARGDILAVRFQNTMQHDATIYTTVSDVAILEIVVAGDFQSVTLYNFPPDRTNDRIDVLILAQASMWDDLKFNAYSSSMIFPTNESHFFPECTSRKDCQDPAFFTIGFSANMDIEATVGAPVYDLTGDFLGVIHSFHEDIVFVRSSQFIPGIRTTIENDRASTSSSASTS